MKCPNCGSELRKGLSFCPKCGNVVSQSKQEAATAATSQPAQAKKKLSFWKIILGILFFPIALTIIIAKSKKIKPVVKIVLIVILWVLVIGMSNTDDTVPNSGNTSSDYENQISDVSSAVSSDEQVVPSGSEEAGKGVATPEDSRKIVVESEKLTQFLYSIKSLEKLTQDQSTNLAEKAGLTSDVDMGWGGTSWQYYFEDAENDDCTVTFFFVTPQQENFAEHLKYMTYYIVNDEGISLHYYSAWNRDNDDDGRYGYYVGDTQFSSLAEAHEHYQSLVFGNSDEQPTIAVKYHGNEQINKILTAYNAIAEYPITPEMVQKGAYNYNAHASCNGVWVTIYATSNNGLFIDYEEEAYDDTPIKPVFRDFCKAINPNATNEDVDTVWAILQTEKHKNYSPYNFDGIDCTYSKSSLSNGQQRYTVKTNCKSYR